MGRRGLLHDVNGPKLGPVRFDNGIEVFLDERQRSFVARKVIVGIDSARANLVRLRKKYPDMPAAGQPMEHAIASLENLAQKLDLEGAGPGEFGDSDTRLEGVHWRVIQDALEELAYDISDEPGEYQDGALLLVNDTLRRVESRVLPGPGSPVFLVRVGGES